MFQLSPDVAAETSGDDDPENISFVDTASSLSISANETEDSDNHSLDGGYGWVCVLCSFIVHFFALGIESSWGVYQSHYFTSDVLGPVSSSNLAWVGSIQATGQPLVGILAGILAQRIGFRITGFMGTCIMCLGLVAASFSTHVWHLYLTQGVMFGVGSGFAFIPAVCIPSQWFTRHRGLATGIAASGYGVGGLVLSPLTQRLIDHFGFRWALRATGLMTLVALGVADIFLKPRASISPPKKIDNRLMTDKVFLCLCSSLDWPVQWSRFLRSSVLRARYENYAVNKLERTAQDGANSAALISAFSAIGRVCMGIVGDYLGHIHILSLCQFLGGVSQMAIWPFVHNLPGLMAFSSFYGFFTGGYVSLYPVVEADLFGAENLASVTGIMFSSFVPGTLLGPPISGAILDRHTNPTNGRINFTPVQMFGGSWLIASAFMAAMVNTFRAEEGRIAI